MDGEARRDSINDLDCIECGRWFATFTALAAHMTKGHTAMAKLPKSKRAAAPARKAKANGAVTSAGRIPRSERDDDAPAFNPFLKAKDIGKGKLGDTSTLVLTGNVRVSDGDYGEQIIAEVKHNGSKLDWAVKLNSPNHRYLEDTLGLETSRWKNKKIPVIIKENMGKLYVAIERPRR